jgi:hypothetical protein
MDLVNKPHNEHYTVLTKLLYIGYFSIQSTACTENTKPIPRRVFTVEGIYCNNKSYQTNEKKNVKKPKNKIKKFMTFFKIK